MTPCDRFERQGILLLEQGRPLDEHFDTCPDCRRARAAYERLRQGIAAAGEEHAPPAGWQARVWAAVEERQRRSRRWRWPWLLVPVGVAAAALLVVVGRAPPPPAAPALEVGVEHGAGPARRGTEAHPGDRLVLRAVTGDARHAELRVYRNDADLVLRCSGEPPCVREESRIRAVLTLRSLGAYQSVLLVADRPLPPPSAAGLDPDVAAALEAGARVELGDEVHVR